MLTLGASGGKVALGSGDGVWVGKAVFVGGRGVKVGGAGDGLAEGTEVLVTTTGSVSVGSGDGVCNANGVLVMAGSGARGLQEATINNTITTAMDRGLFLRAFIQMIVYCCAKIANRNRGGFGGRQIRQSCFGGLKVKRLSEGGTQASDDF
jgi:hypothetical protein